MYFDTILDEPFYLNIVLNRISKILLIQLLLYIVSIIYQRITITLKTKAV